MEEKEKELLKVFSQRYRKQEGGSYDICDDCIDKDYLPFSVRFGYSPCCKNALLTLKTWKKNG